MTSRMAILSVVGLLFLAMIVFWSSLTALAEIWSHPDRRTYQHGYLISAIALWLLFRDWQRIGAAVAWPVPLLLVAAALGSALWAVAWNAGLQAGHVLLWPAVTWLAVTGATGWRVGRLLLFPMGFLYFAMPAWEVLMPVLQSGTVVANHLMALLVGVPVLIEGHLIHIPAGSFLIAGGCSGLNYFLVGLAVGALQGEVNGDSGRRRALLIALAGGMAILSNWIRVFLIILAGHLTDMQHYLVQVDHYNFGWVLYAFMLVGYFLIVRRLPESPQSEQVTISGAGHRVSRLALGAASVILISAAVLTANAASDSSLPIGEAPAVDGWQSEFAIGDWRPVFPGADQEWVRSYSSGRDVVTAYSAVFLRQGQSRELVSHGSSIAGAGTSRLKMGRLPFDGGHTGIPMTEGELVGADGQGRAVLRWTYQIGQRQMAKGLQAQLWYGISAMYSKPISAIVVIRAECLPDCAAARQTLDDFAVVALPPMLAAAARPESREGR